MVNSKRIETYAFFFQDPDASFLLQKILQSRIKKLVFNNILKNYVFDEEAEKTYLKAQLPKIAELLGISKKEQENLVIYVNNDDWEKLLNTLLSS